MKNQKTITLIPLLAALLINPGFVSAQVESARFNQNPPQSSYYELVRAVEPGKFVAYSKNAAGSHGSVFSLIGNTGILQQIKIHDDITILDFKVLDNIVFFCGQDGSYRRGVIGAIPISDFNTNNYRLCAKISDFECTLFDLEVCKTTLSGLYQIVALGSDVYMNQAIPFNNTGNLVVKISYDFESGLSERLFARKDSTRTFHDLIQTEKYFIIAEQTDVPGLGGVIGFRRWDKLMLNCSEMDYLWYFPVRNEPGGQNIKCAYTQESMFVTASPDWNDLPTWSMNVRYFDENTMQMVMPGHRIQYPEKLRPVEMVYLKDANQLALSQEHADFMNGNRQDEVVFYKLYANPPYLADVFYQDWQERLYQGVCSIDALDGNSMIAGCSYYRSWWYKNVVMPHEDILSCCETVQYKADPIMTQPVIRITMPLVDITLSWELSSIAYTTTPFFIDIPCRNE